MYIKATNVNEHASFYQQLQELLASYKYKRTDELCTYPIYKLIEENFSPLEYLYEPRPYKFLKNCFKVELDTQGSSATFIINGYDLYTNKNYDVIVVSSQGETNYGNPFLIIDEYKDSLVSEPTLEAANTIRKYLLDNEDDKKLIKLKYSIKEQDNLDLSYEDLFLIYEALQQNSYEEFDNGIGQKILSYLYSKDVLSVDTEGQLKLKQK